jgi:asparagine synthase (glutamine-hydrolysing)
MSGIAAAIDSCGTGAGALLQAALGAMAHYGWYRVSEWHDDADRAAAGQIAGGVFNGEPAPLWSRDGNLALWFCGELNYTDELRAELKRHGAPEPGMGHAELALCAYEALGETFAEVLEGAFLVAIWHVRERRLVVVNDRFGLYPHYYLRAHGRLILAPEVKGILVDPAVRPEIDHVALAEYVRFQFLLGDKTFFQDIKLLPAATCCAMMLRMTGCAFTSIGIRPISPNERRISTRRPKRPGACCGVRCVSAPAGRGGWACT